VDVLGLMIALLLAALLLLPAWPYSAKWGLLPAGICGILSAGTAALAFFGRL
jgi:hypothetical protein